MMLFKLKQKSAPQGERDILSLYIEVTDIHVGRYRIGQHPAAKGGRAFQFGSDELVIVGNLYEYRLNNSESKPGNGDVDISIKLGPSRIYEDGTFGEILFFNFSDPFYSPKTYLLVEPQILKDLIEEIRWRKPMFVTVAGMKSVIEEIGGPCSMRFDVFDFELFQSRMGFLDIHG